MTLTNQVPEKEVHDLFTRVSSNYDKINNVVSLGTQTHWRHVLFNKLNIKKGAFCLDLCTGTGDLAIGLAKSVGPSGNVIGLDFNKSMLDICKQKVRLAGFEKEVQIKQADAMHLPYKTNSFDYVTIGFGLRNVPDAGQVIKEAYRVLKPAGKFAILETSQPTNRIVKIGWKVYLSIFPRIVKIFNADMQDYQYLSKTTTEFLTADNLKKLMEKHNFRDVSVTKLYMGAAVIHIGQK